MFARKVSVVRARKITVGMTARITARNGTVRPATTEITVTNKMDKRK